MARNAPIRWLVLPMVITLALFAAYVAFYAIPNAVLYMALIVLIVPQVTLLWAVLAVLLVVASVALWLRHWLAGAAMVVGLVVLALSIVVPTPGRSVANFAVHVVQILAYRDELITQSNALRRERITPAVAQVAVDGFGSMTRGLAYDPTGEILLPRDKRSAAWNAVAGQSDLGLEGLEVQHVFGYYYSWFHF
jgi:hypothetical protein